jgi:hypothetical protein
MAVGMATGWKVGRCRHVQISVSIEKCDQAVMDLLAATDVGKFPPKLAEEPGQEELRHLAGSPGGGGVVLGSVIL